MTWTDRVTRTPADCERAERAHSYEAGRWEDAEPDPPFTMPTPPGDDSPYMAAFRRVFQGETT